MALFAPLAMMGQSTLTVNEGTTTNGYIPVYGYYADTEGLTSEFVIPAADLAAMNGGSISAMSFYVSTPATSAWGATFQVYMTEVDGTTLSGVIGPDECTVVYTGELDGTGTTMDITFDDDYVYGGGNLLIGTCVTGSGSWLSASFYGIEATEAAFCSYEGWYGPVNSPQNFLPQTTFTYTTGGGPTCAKPSGLTASQVPDHPDYVQLSWTENGSATQWQICLDDDETQLLLTSQNPCQIDGLTLEETYSFKVRAYCDASNQSAWSGSVSFTPTDKIVIGSGTATNGYLPTNTYYNYSLTEQIYTSAEIGSEAGLITTLDFYCSSVKTRTLDIYMVSTDKTSFESATDWVAVTSNDLVYSGDVTFTADAWTTITLDTGFGYDGTSNVVLVVDDNTGGYVNAPTFRVFDAPSQALRIYNDDTNYDPTAPSAYSGTVMSVKNQIRLSLLTGTIYEITATAEPENYGTVSGGGSYMENTSCTLTATPNVGYEFSQWTKNNEQVAISASYTFTVTEDATYVAHFKKQCPIIVSDPDLVELGNRPAGAWMRPYEFTIVNNGGNGNITDMQFEGAGVDALSVDLGNTTLPFTLNHDQSKQLGLTWGDEPAAVNGILQVWFQNEDYTGYSPITVTANVYTPAIGDVWEMPKTVTTFPYTESLNATAIPLYNNYFIPKASKPDGYDVVYKLVFEEDTQLTATITSGEDGKAALYEEGFQGLGGPDVNNNYTGPQVGATRGGERSIVEIGELEGAANNSFLPMNSMYNYSYTQQIYTADEIGTGGTINAITMWLYGNANLYEMPFNIYMVEVDKDAFTSNTDWVTVTESDMVYTGSVTVHNTDPEAYTFELDAPFNYSGIGNLLIAFNNLTGSWKSGLNGKVFGASSDPVRAIYARQDSAPYDPYNPTFSANSTTYQRNVLAIDLTGGSLPDPGIHDMTVAPGTYYLVASSTSENFSVSIETGALECPDIVSSPTPADEAMGVSDLDVQLKWKLGARTTEYCLKFGTSVANLETLVDWTRELQQQYTLDTLDYHTTYYWQVCERNDGCPAGVEGPVWSFTTTLNPPTNFDGEAVLIDGETLHLIWTAPAAHRELLSYNLYLRTNYTDDSIANTTNTFYNIDTLQHTGSGTSTTYTYAVKAVYSQGLSGTSNYFNTHVYAPGTVQGHVYEQDGTTPIANATVTYEYGVRSFTFTTDATGAYSGTVVAANFYAGEIYASAQGYADAVYDGVTVTVPADGSGEPVPTIDFIMDEFFYPAVDVVAQYHPDPNNYDANMAKVTWSAPDGVTRDANAPRLRTIDEPEPEAGDAPRSMQYYRLYRTTWDNNGPFNMENTVLVADNLTTPGCIDNDFALLPNGVYKYGVGVVYAGNHNRGGNRAASYLEVDFEDGIPSDWNTIDADGDGYDWVLGSEVGGIYLNAGGSLAGTGHNGSENMIVSGSYSNVAGALYPDNYLVSPQVQLGDVLTFWACAQDASYAAEHFGVAVSTTGNSDPDDFTTIQEWTMTAKGSGAKTSVTRSGNRTQGSWYQYTVDLSAYAGQQGYIAFRHFDCTDQFLLNLDDIAYGTPPAPIQLERESEIAWSNAMDRGQWLYNQVSLTVTLNTGDSPEGVHVFLRQDPDQQAANAMAPEDLSFDLDATGTFTWERFRKGNYTIEISKEDYWTMEYDEVIDGPAALEYELYERVEAVEDLYISRTGWVMWDGKGEDGLPLDGTRQFLNYYVSLWSFDWQQIGEAISTDKNYLQLPTDQLVAGEKYWVEVVSHYSTGYEHIDKVWTYQPCDLLEGATETEALVDAAGVNLSWTYPEIDPTGTRTVNNDEDWYYYDNGTFATSIGLAGTGYLSWGIMIPAGSYEGDMITSFSVFDAQTTPWCDVYFYNDGETAPAGDIVGATEVDFTGSGEFITEEFYNPIFIDPTKNVWVVCRASNLAMYPAAACTDTGDPNGRWISVDGETWGDVTISSTHYTWMLRAEIKSSEPSPLSDDILGAALFRDGEWIAFTSEDHFVDTVGTIDSEYELRMVYDGEKANPNHNSYYAMSCPQTIDVAYRQYTIGATANPTEGGTIEGAGVYDYSSTATLTAAANEGYDFINWTKEGEEVTTELSFGFTVNEDADFVANFELRSYEITATADPAEGGTVTGGDIYYHFDTCTLVAEAAVGYDFVNWTKDGEVVSEDATYSFEVTAAGAYVANFALKSYEITATANPTAGGTITGAGTYNHFATCTLTATAATGYTFLNWTDAGGEVVATEATFGFEVTGAAAYTANFELNSYEITAVANPEAGGTVTGAGTYNHGATCTLVATVAEGYTFINWTKGNEVITDELTYEFVVTEAGDYVANFEINTYEVALVGDPTDGGVLTGADTYEYGASVTITATVNPGYTFINWTKDGAQVSNNATYTFTMSEATAGTYMAHFSQNEYVVTGIANPEAGGVVTGGGGFNYGEECTLTVTPNEGYTFINWTNALGAEVSTELSFTISVTESASYVANLSLNTYAITVVANPTEGGTVRGGGTYEHGTTISLTAIAAEGYNFINWTKGNEEVSTDAIFNLTVTEAGDYVANFELANITQTSDFVVGWTWWSTYIDTEDADVLGQLKDGLGDNGHIIKSQTAATTHLPNGTWAGTLPMDNQKGYMVKALNEASVDIVGPAVEPADHPITLTPGWTWIGYPCSEAMPVAEALAGHTPQSGDVIKTQSASAVYMLGSWRGALTLTPGAGYMYKSGSTSNVTLTYATPTGRGGYIEPEVNHHWMANYHAYQSNMTVLAVVELNGEELHSANYELAAFAGNECRGSVAMMYVEPLDRYMALLTISGEEAAELHFGLYNTETGEEYFGAEETLSFETDAMVGDADAPFVVRFRGTTGVDELAKSLQVYPNPVKAGSVFSVGSLTNVDGEVRVEIINAVGAKVSEQTSVRMPASIKAPTTAGVYMLKITVNGKETCSRKLVVR